MKPKLTDAERKLRKLANQAKYRKTHAEKLKADRDKWYAENPSYNSTYYAANASKIKTATAQYAKANPERSRAYVEVWRKANLDKVRAINAAWRKANPDKCKTYGMTYRAKHPGKLQAKESAYRLTNPAKRTAWQAKRKAAQLNATPAWADLNAIKAIYLEANRLGMEVDHIVPLQGKTVCGLHVSNNLQLLTKSENSRKRNTHPE